MKRVDLRRKCLVLVAVVTAFMILAVPILAQQGDLAAGRMAGSTAARTDTNGTAWLAIGCLFGCLGVGAAYVLEPNPPTTALLGKSPEYVAAYTDSYRQTAKRKRTSKAWTGCVVGTLLSIASNVAVYSL